MVSYEYQELFYKQHQTKDFLIVDANATVTSVSGEAPTVSGATIEIHTADIESESFQLDESICSEANLKFGLCESAKVEFTIKNKADIPNLKSSDYGDLLNIYLYFNGDSDTLFQIGQYVCYKDEYTSNRKLRNIELYDLNFTLNDLDITSWYNQYFSDGNRHEIIWVIADLFNWINKSGSYANDDSSPNIHIEIDPVYTLCNGAFPIGKTIESDTITFGFFMQGLLEFNGAFGHITREGKFKFLVMESYDATPCRTVTDDFRKPPTNYSDDNTWGIGQIDVYGRNNEMKFTQQNTDKKKPSIYVMVDPWVLADREAGDSYTNNAVRTLLITINHYNYNKSETECSGDLCIEVGDRYNVEFTQASQYDTRNWFRSYVLERHFKGIQSMHDTYTAKGDKKQPLYQITNGNWHIGDSTTATQGQGTGGVSELNDEHDRRLIEIMRNYGQPMLDEPTVELTYNKGDSQVEIKWTDPADITSYSPLPVEWAGTIVVRKEGSQPIHRWGTEHSAFGGTVLVDSTTRDAYSVTAYADDTIEPNKRYYYAIMPYFVALDDAQHPIKHYRWTKVYSVDTTRILVAPTIYPIQNSQISGTTVTVAYTIPTLTEGSYTVKKLVVKKNNIPTSKTDGDKIIDLTPDPSLLINGVDVEGLDYGSLYYFVIFVEDEIGSSASSEPRDCVIGEDLGYNFDYTGEIVEWTVPKTGIYSLETWGAQGGNATNGTNTARGGYGAYAYGETLLTQGDKLYINVGGQNGYGGGGDSMIEKQLSLPVSNTINLNRGDVSAGNANILSATAQEKELYFYKTDNVLLFGQTNATALTVSNNVYRSNLDSSAVNSHTFNNYYLGGLKNIKHISVKGRGITAGFYSTLLEIRFYDVENGIRYNGIFVENVPISSEFTLYEANVDCVANYIEIHTVQGTVEFKDLIITYVA